MYRLFLVAVALLAALPVWAELKLTVGTDRPDALYKSNEEISFVVSTRADGKSAVGTRVSYRIEADGAEGRNGEFVVGGGPEVLRLKAPGPGFVLCTVTAPDVKDRSVTARAGAGVEVEKIRSTQQIPADFDAFWEKARTEVGQIPMIVRRKIVPVDGGDVLLYDVQIDCAGSAPVSGYLSIPKKFGRYPARIGYDGAGVRSAYRATDPEMIVFSVNAHGIENGREKEFYDQLSSGALQNYARREWKNPDSVYFRGMFQRIIRAHEFVKSLRQWDGKNLIVSGGSQGGAQAVAAAALDPDVTVMVSWVPALADLSGSLHGRKSGWPKPDVTDPKILAATGYYDTANFATRVPPGTACLMMVGFQDLVCVPSSVYSAFNNLKAKEKKMLHDIPGGHRLMPQGEREIGRFIQGHLIPFSEQEDRQVRELKVTGPHDPGLAAQIRRQIEDRKSTDLQKMFSDARWNDIDRQEVVELLLADLLEQYFSDDPGRLVRVKAMFRSESAELRLPPGFSIAGPYESQVISVFFSGLRPEKDGAWRITGFAWPEERRSDGSIVTVLSGRGHEYLVRKENGVWKIEKRLSSIVS